MVFSNFVIDFFSSLILIFKRFFLLIFFPYKTMRKISLEKDLFQPIIIFMMVFGYFQLSSGFRRTAYSSSATFFVFLSYFLVSAFFFYLLGKFFEKKTDFFSYLITFSYSLFPTLVWFMANFIFYILVPPPRTVSFLGKGFSIFFTAFSLSLLLWKLILFYLSIRFSSKAQFYRIVYFIFLFFCWFIPLSVGLYQIKMFRIPFI
jgi:hypothetical protein